MKSTICPWGSSPFDSQYARNFRSTSGSTRMLNWIFSLRSRALGTMDDTAIGYFYIR